jgi:hypothetical protein
MGSLNLLSQECLLQVRLPEHAAQDSPQILQEGEQGGTILKTRPCAAAFIDIFK